MKIGMEKTEMYKNDLNSLQYKRKYRFKFLQIHGSMYFCLQYAAWGIGNTHTRAREYSHSDTHTHTHTHLSTV